MARSAAKELEAVLNLLNNVTGESFSLDGAYGGWALEIDNGSRKISPRLSRPALIEWIRAFLEGYGWKERRARMRTNPRRTRKNPPLVTFGNPGKLVCLSKNVVDIRYQHAQDGKYYHHEFKPGQVQIHAEAGGNVAFLRRVDGKPLIEDY